MMHNEGRGGVSFGRARGLLYFRRRGLLPRSWKSLPCRKLSEGRKLAMVQDTLVEPKNAAPHTDNSTPDDFQLGIEGFTYGDLYRPTRLRALAEVFYAEVTGADPALGDALSEYVASRGAQLRGTKAESDILIAAAPHLPRFVARLFRVEREREVLAESIKAQDPVFQFKSFVQRRATKSFPAEKAAGIDVETADAALEALRRAAFADTLADDRELGVARTAARLLEWEKNYPKEGARQDEPWSDERARQTEAAAKRIAGTQVERALAAWRVDGDEGGADKNRAETDENRAFVRAWL